VRGGRVEAGPLRVPLPERASAAEGEAVVLGVRPEALRPAADGAEAVVEVVERAGPERLWHVRAGDVRLAVRPPADAVAAVGDVVRLAADPAGARLFAADDGRAL
jgi:ABC-type sugar transport system ATPase subunit